jgi:dihydroorotase
MQTLTLTRPDDWHIHLRDGDYLPTTVGDVARSFGRAIVMPNLTPPVTTVPQALAYRNEILLNRPTGSDFEPLMTLYLTDQTRLRDIIEAAQSPQVHACKLYPAGATTNSEAGVGSIEGLYPIFEAMAQHQLPLLIHGEVTDEKRFLSISASCQSLQGFQNLKSFLSTSRPKRRPVLSRHKAPTSRQLSRPTTFCTIEPICSVAA